MKSDHTQDVSSSHLSDYFAPFYHQAVLPFCQQVAPLCQQVTKPIYQQFIEPFSQQVWQQITKWQETSLTTTSTAKDQSNTQLSNVNSVVENVPSINFFLPKSGVMTFFTILDQDCGLSYQRADSLGMKELKKLIALVISVLSLPSVGFLGMIYNGTAAVLKGALWLYATLEERAILGHAGEEYYDAAILHIWKGTLDALAWYYFPVSLLTTAAFFIAPSLFVTAKSNALYQPTSINTSNVTDRYILRFTDGNTSQGNNQQVIPKQKESS